MPEIKCTTSMSNQTEPIIDKVLEYYRTGFPVIPILPGTKRTSVKWDPWLEGLGEESIKAYWKDHPDHGVGFIVPEGLVVFDADTPTAVSALYQIEQSFDLTCRFIVKTKRGEHHYFRLASGTKIKTCSMNTAKFPLGIDVKARRSMVILP